jgi:EAL domain-containing protein (putative c-di-GMP-specific phosphodiesterase class I)/CheY-like chemotaxis protein
LLGFVDVALQQAKDRGGDNCQLTSEKILAGNRHQLDMVEALRGAIGTEQLFLKYQPLVDLQSGLICDVEALIRWTNTDNETVAPTYFIELAEKSGLIIDIGNWAIRQACADLRNWSDQGNKPYRVALNISPAQFHDPSLAETIATALHESQIAPNLLCVEITEAVLVQDHPSALSTLNKLIALGVGLILDDFGTGFSSLSYLKRLPFLKVKIDRSFIKNIPDDNNDAAISKAIISMAHSLGIRVVAEGVETEAQCSFLSQNMCDEIQGYLFSDALAATEIDALLKEGRCLPAKLLRLQRPERTLLLVDDESNILGALKRLLRRGDFRILTANNGQAGLDILAEQPVDVIVSDQRMPGMTGVEFLGKAKQLYPDTVRIVLSGYTELHSVTDAVNEGAIYKFLTKPWDDEQLYGHIEEAFKRKEMADENRRLNLEVLSANQELATANHRLGEMLKQQQQQIVRDEVSLDIVREALQKIPLAVIGIDDDDTVVFANDAAQNLFEDIHSILGSDVNQLIPDLVHATPNSNRGLQCIAEIDGKFYEVVARRMGRGSQSRGKLLTISTYKAIA